MIREKLFPLLALKYISIQALIRIKMSENNQQFLANVRKKRITSKAHETLVKKTLKQRKLSKSDYQKEFNNYMKQCLQCKNEYNGVKWISCTGCEDVIHSQCVSADALDENNEYICMKCDQNINDQDQFVNYLAQFEKPKTLRVLWFDDEEQIQIQKFVCIECHNKIVEQNEKKQCLQCGYYIHNECFDKEMQIMNFRLCKSCITLAEAYIPKDFKMLSKFIALWDENIKQQDKGKAYKNKVYRSQFKNKFTLLLPNYPDTKEEKLNFQYSLILALFVKSYYFYDDLCYVNCDERKNNQKHEPKLQELDEKNKSIFARFKEESRKGFYGQILVEFDEKQGFIAKATAKILKNTIICEYAGQVKTYQSIAYDTNDSIMVFCCLFCINQELLKHPKLPQSLYIIPENSANLARYISGINNTCEQVGLYIAYLRVDKSKIFSLQEQQLTIRHEYYWLLKETLRPTKFYIMTIMQEGWISTPLINLNDEQKIKNQSSRNVIAAAQLTEESFLSLTRQDQAYLMNLVSTM